MESTKQLIASPAPHVQSYWCDNLPASCAFSMPTCCTQHIKHSMVSRDICINMSLSPCVTSGDSKQPAKAVFPHDLEHQAASRALSEPCVIPEHLLTNKQAAALLSGIPAHLRAAKAQHRESILQLSEPGLEAEPGIKLCYIQGGRQ